MGAAQFAAGLGVPQSSPVFAVGQAADATGYTQTAARVQPTRTVLLATLPHKSPSAAPESGPCQASRERYSLHPWTAKSSTKPESASVKAVHLAQVE